MPVIKRKADPEEFSFQKEKQGDRTLSEGLVEQYNHLVKEIFTLFTALPEWLTSEKAHEIVVLGLSALGNIQHSKEERDTILASLESFEDINETDSIKDCGQRLAETLLDIVERIPRVIQIIPQEEVREDGITLEAVQPFSDIVQETRAFLEAQGIELGSPVPESPVPDELQDTAKLLIRSIANLEGESSSNKLRSIRTLIDIWQTGKSSGFSLQHVESMKKAVEAKLKGQGGNVLADINKTEVKKAFRSFFDELGENRSELEKILLKKDHLKATEAIDVFWQLCPSDEKITIGNVILGVVILTTFDDLEMPLQKESEVV